MHASLELRLARRNLWRNPRRTILTLSAVAFATAILVFMIAFQQGGYHAMIESAVGVFTGDLQIQAAGYHDKPRLEKSLDGASTIEKRVASVPGVQAVAARAQAYALVSSASRTHGAAIVGVQPEREPRVSTLPKSIREGRFLGAAKAAEGTDAPGDGASPGAADAPDPSLANEAIVGKTLAKNLGLSVGDTLTVLGQGNDGALAAATLTVVGIFQSGVPDLDRNTVEIPLQTFQDVFSMPDQAHAIVVRTKSLDRVDHVEQVLSQAFAGRAGLVVLPWQDLLEGLKQGITLDAAVGWFLYAVLVFVVTFSILNTFLMAVLERTREFGVLLALGTRSKQLGRIVMTESVLLLLLGLLVGLGLGVGFTSYIGHQGLAFSGSEELLARWNLPVRIYPRLNWFSLTVGPVVILVVTCLAALFPLFRIRRLRPVDAMKAV